MEGGKPKRCAPLFRALAELRRREMRTAETDPLAGIRVQPEDIPPWN
jgi:hypothetical protein